MTGKDNLLTWLISKGPILLQVTVLPILVPLIVAEMKFKPVGSTSTTLTMFNVTLPVFFTVIVKAMLVDGAP